MEMETKKWRALMRRLLRITLFLAKQGLPFREPEEEGSDDDESEKGDSEKDPPLNEGNFIATVELFSESDPLLKQYLRSLKQGACESYLSPETQDELISALANHAREKLAMDIKSAPYFALMFDCTPDIGRTDQMAEGVRYVKVGNGKVEVKEAFLRLFPYADHSSDFLKNLERDGLDIMMCRAQYNTDIIIYQYNQYHYWCRSGWSPNRFTRLHSGKEQESYFYWAYGAFA